MSYKSSDFLKMEMNPLVLEPGELIWRRYAKLRRRPILSELPDVMNGSLFADQFHKGEFTEGDASKLVSFGLIFCDFYNNPLASETDFEFRRKTALGLIGIRKNELIYDVIKTDDIWACSVYAAVLRMSNNDLYSAWMAKKFAFYQDVTFLTTSNPLTDEKISTARMKINSSIEENEAAIRKIEARLFRDDRLAALINEAAASERPEHYAEENAREWQ